MGSRSASPSVAATVKWVASKSSFVNLPFSLAQSFHNSSASAGSIFPAIRIQASSLQAEGRKTETKGSRDIYVSWAGGSSFSGSSFLSNSDVLEIDSVYGQLLGLHEGQKVSIAICPPPKACKSVSVEPYSEDDWEILELHASYLENEFLNQTRVVVPGQPCVVWVHQATPIRLKIISTDTPGSFSILGNDTELVVKPMERQKGIKPNTTPMSNHIYGPELRLRHLPRSADEYDDLGGTTALVSPKDYGAVSVSSSRTNCIARIRLILQRPTRPTEGQGEAPRPSGNGDSEPQAESSGSRSEARRLLEQYVVLCPSRSVAPGLIVLSPTVQANCAALAFDRISVAVIQSSISVPSPMPTLIVSHHIEGDKLAVSSTGAGANLVDPKRRFTAWLQDTVAKSLFIINHRMTVNCIAPSQHCLDEEGEAATCRFTLSFQPEEGSSLPDFMLIDKDSHAKLVLLHTTDTKSVQTEESREPVRKESHALVLGGVDPILLQLNQFVRLGLYGKDLTAVCRGYCPAFLVHGGSGHGKTSIMEYIAFQSMKELAVYDLYLDCREIVQESTQSIERRLRQIFADALWRAPSLVLLDNIDVLVPAENEQQQHAQPSSRSAVIAGLILRLASDYSTMGIMLGVSSQHSDTIHGLLAKSSLFEEQIQIVTPNLIQRGEILKALLARHGGSMPEEAFRYFASQTEGYTPRDLHAYLNCAVHQREIRTAGDPGSGDGQISVSDLQTAKANWIPSALKSVKHESSVSWDEIGGMDGPKRVLMETLKWPTLFAPIFAKSALRLRSGLLLYGYPGCGKTVLASAVAKECGLNFISVKGPELLNMYIGQSEKSVRDLFERAQAAKPCLLFFDEFDAIAPRRGQDTTGVTDRVVNQLLTQMDGAEGLSGVYVLAATSRPEMIDPALLRPGRLDKTVFCNLPDEQERLSILKAVCKKLHLHPSVDLESLGSRTDGFTGADLQALVYNAHLESVHTVLDAIQVSKDDRAAGPDTDGSKFLRSDEASGDETATQLASIRANMGQRMGSTASKGTKPESMTKVYVTMAHLNSALATTRPSLEPREVNRLQRIYSEFQSGGIAVPVGQKVRIA
ncbi:P-loop containing nucleoside triphosphate hydrolase protein [Polychytrium aggregatum]|uniref:P-loop containing nucleoside triphosphate hydrolase protein n=1 Tax=Polychytrium aggregatum TaxID=110093 RepID=UPI0022FDE6BD|nr:P-loop containing nucleoside triphosphate hydrolase protein [Polychytrium aggregatum]KAI9199853.1 P-loop containing nucleoside triphosphate hydrolase protein [Polychytrium aggregatum]